MQQHFTARRQQITGNGHPLRWKCHQVCWRRRSSTRQLCADVQAWQKQPQRYWQQADNATQTLLVDMLTNFYAGKPQLQRDEALRSCGMVAQTVMLAARALGYDSCPMIGFDAEAVAQQIALPDEHLIGLMLAIGTAAQPANPRGGLLAPHQVLMLGRFGQQQAQAA